MSEYLGTATYSPEDNKLRLYPFARLSKEDYERVKAHGFKWAPKQELFFTPSWNPQAEDLLIEICGEIGDEDKSLSERAEERAERFENYSEKRTQDAESARKAVSAIADGIPFGQPILIGHHSERHARKDAERIENGMRKAVKNWETAKYWEGRAASAISAAKYKERPEVRARRIKTIEADRRRVERSKAESERALKFWRGELKFKNASNPEPRTIAITEDNRATICELLGGMVGTYAGVRFNDENGKDWSAWDYLQPDGERYAACPAKPVEECRQVAERVFTRSLERCARWLTHYDNRLAYEKAMLAADGGILTDQIKPEVGGACRCWMAPGHGKGWAIIQKVNRVTVTVFFNYGYNGKIFSGNMPLDKIHGMMSHAQVQEARAAGRLMQEDKCGFYYFDGDDLPPKPAAVEPKEPEKAANYAAMKDSLKAGVQIVTANQLFPTPRELAERMADLADIKPGHSVLEPSAGTGILLGSFGCRMFGHNPERGDVTAIEINPTLAERLRREFPKTRIRCADFLDCIDERKFDRIVMNPPFENGADIKHILHARSQLRPGGKLVAICANGPRQENALQPIADSWEELPADTFAEQGTGVRTVLLTMSAEEQPAPTAVLVTPAKTERKPAKVQPDPSFDFGELFARATATT